MNTALASLAAIAAADDGAWRDAARTFLSDTDAALAARFDADEPIDRLLAARSAGVDSVLCSAWQRSNCASSNMHLLATGGYGRGELFPASDVDLLVLAEADVQAAQHEALAHFFTLLWDVGLSAGHAVRSLAQCVQAARDDLTVVTALSEWRMLCGKPDAAQRLARALSASTLWPAGEYFAEKRDEQRQRHARFNDTAYNLEPNIKEGPGGLRDIHTLVWMAM